MNQRVRKVPRRVWVAAAVILLAVGGAFWLARARWNPPPPVAAAAAVAREHVPRQELRGEFSASDSCKSCHEEQYASWHKTYHRTMTQVATPDTVVAPFDGVELVSGQRRYSLERDGDGFWATTVDPDWEAWQLSQGIDPSRVADPPRVRKPVVMTTGSHHMQGYWIPRGRELLQIPFYYYFAEQRWIPREDVFLRTPERDTHLANWSMTCIKCHSVAGVPGGDPTQMAMNPQVAELGIACEACHGPGAQHIRRNAPGQAAGAQHAAGQAIVNPAQLPARRQSEICGQCHSEFWPADPIGFWTKGIGYRAGQDFENSVRVIRFGDAIYQQFEDKYKHTFWSDGTCRVGGDEFNGLIESPCYQRGELSCLSCHSMHQSDPDDMLAAGMDGNQACQQCHSEPRFNDDVAQHTHHAAGSSGSLCYNCHMPHTSYALLTAMRSHRVTVPRVESIVHNRQPNACNLCHLDQTLAWTAGKLADWYGTPTVAVQEDEQEIAASLLWLLRGDAMQRAIAAWHMGWPPAQEAAGNHWQAPFLAQLLLDPYAGVRYQAIRAAQSLPGLADFDGDFIGSDEHRLSAMSGLLDAWTRGRAARSGSPTTALLLTPAGEVQQSQVEQLLRRRDDSYVRIPE